MGKPSNYSVRVTRDEFRSCGSCGAQNYDTTWTPKKVPIIFDVKIGNIVNAMCPNCLRQLALDSIMILDAVAALTDVPAEETVTLPVDDDKPPFDV